MRALNGIDAAAVARIADERLDWRFKAVPDRLFGTTIGDAVHGGLGLVRDGFLGPVLTIDDEALEHNLSTMAHWAAGLGVSLAPHGKTTMAPQLFARQLAHGAWGLTCANAGQLRVYRAFGVQRILLANQLVDPPALHWLAGQLADPGFEFLCWVDSVAGVGQMADVLRAAGARRPVDVLVELGGDGGRTGTRSLDEAVAVAEAVHATPELRLVGVGGYEGALAHDASTADLSIVDAYLVGIRELTIDLADRELLADAPEVIVTVGGSAYFDQVAAALTALWPDGLTVRPVLRSGAYLTHDDGFYRDVSPLGAHPRITGTPPLKLAFTIWAQVTSRPEPGLALLTMGKRDASFDEGMPVPRRIRTATGTAELTGCRVTKLNDQHAFLELAPGAAVAVGDWIGLGLSHPCTVFDKWSLIPLVAADGETVVDLIRTYF
ncbi:alanine racemase [Labedaea rhizosphaerae]|uniref:D-serine deaminase-like pyridoxal phosphate-dependent protein n=1 Tax=Labedaea rhizosphaerae TaxID=598644 RepID=A0A4R6SBY6_LABRH|nr:alanine racemase [Labedaea rhizosphaerae]TDP97063.1 D-serine deaminase-like pyridoxal phosphate-dependent protein [Labedaea rhizosphaerae]